MDDIRDELKEHINLDISQEEIIKQEKAERLQKISSNVKNKNINEEDLMYVVRETVQKILQSSLHELSINPKIKNLEDSEKIEKVSDCILQSDVFEDSDKFLGNIAIKGKNYMKIINLLKSHYADYEKLNLEELASNIQVTAAGRESTLVNKINRIKENKERSNNK